VVKAFPIGEYFLMLDSKGDIRIEKAQGGYDANEIDGLKDPLVKVAVWS
jgi:hypothetical protein